MPNLRDTGNSRIKLPLPVDSGSVNTPSGYADRIRVGLNNPPSAGNSVQDWIASLLTRVLPSVATRDQGRLLSVGSDNAPFWDTITDILSRASSFSLLRGRVDGLEHLSVDLEQNSAIPAYANAPAAEAQLAVQAASSAADEFVLRTAQDVSGLAWGTTVTAPALSVNQFGTLLFLRIADGDETDRFSVWDNASSQRFGSGLFTRLGVVSGWVYYQWNNHPHAWRDATFDVQKAATTTHIGTTTYKGDVTEEAVLSATPQIENTRKVVNINTGKLADVSFTNGPDVAAVAGDDIRVGYVGSADGRFPSLPSDWDAYKFALSSPSRTISEHVHLLIFLSYNPNTININEWTVGIGDTHLTGNHFITDETSVTTTNLPTGWVVRVYTSTRDGADLLTVPRNTPITLYQHAILPTWNGALGDGIVSLDDLADAVAARLLPSTLGSANQQLRVNPAGDGTEWFTPS